MKLGNVSNFENFQNWNGIRMTIPEMKLKAHLYNPSDM